MNRTPGRPPFLWWRRGARASGARPVLDAPKGRTTREEHLDAPTWPGRSRGRGGGQHHRRDDRLRGDSAGGHLDADVLQDFLHPDFLHVSDDTDRVLRPRPPEDHRNAVADIDAFLSEVLEKKGSDLHFIAGDPPRVRQYGDLMALRPDKLAAEFVKQARARGEKVDFVWLKT